MAITIKKEGCVKNVVWRVDVTCSHCGCEFSCDNTDFDCGVVKCPTCGKKIQYIESDTYVKVTKERDMISEVKRKIKEDVFENINFEKIHAYMTNVMWKWAGSRSDSGIPTIYELRDCVGELIDSAIDKKSTIATGGFVVRYMEYEKDEDYPHTIGVRVSFELDDVESHVNVDNGDMVYY